MVTSSHESSFHSCCRTITAAVQRLNRTPVHSSCIKDQFSVDSHNSSFIWTFNHRAVGGFVCGGHLSISVERHQSGILINKEGGMCESQNVPVRACLWNTWPELKSQGQLRVWAPYQWQKPQQIWCATGQECIDALNHSGEDLLSKNQGSYHRRIMVGSCPGTDLSNFSLSMGLVVKCYDFLLSMGLVVRCYNFSLSMGLTVWCYDFLLSMGLAVHHYDFSLSMGLVVHRYDFSLSMGLVAKKRYDYFIALPMETLLLVVI